jgi:hypothetical protein
MVVPQEQVQGKFLPDFDRVSVLAGMITLAYIMTHFVDIPTQVMALQLPGVYLAVQIDINTLVGILVAGLTAVGADWIFQDHPARKDRILPHLILPALSAWVIGLPLNQTPFGWGWWLVLAGGVLLLTLVLIGEYISINTEDTRQPLAAAGLTAVSYALYLVLATSLRSGGTRLFLALPGLTLGAWLVSLRVLHLRLQGQWLVYENAIIASIVSQFTAALYYWPITPVAFGVLVLGPTYALTSLIGGLVEERPLRNAIIEPALAVLIAIGVAVWAS